MNLFPFHARGGKTTLIGGKRLRVRAFRRADRERILAITREAFDQVCYEAHVERAAGPIEGTSWADRKERGIDSDLNYYGKSTFVAEIDGEVVGYVTTRLYHAYRTGHVANLAVAVRFQSQGIGRALMEHALEFFRHSGMGYARVETMDNNERGQRLYPSFGFQEIGRQVNYFMRL
jgi:ribosomal protein S18 acetylase RimI-like enzyme